MLPVGNHLTDQAVIGIHLILGLALQLGIFPQGIGSIRQRDLQLHGRFAGLGRMGLIHDDGEALAAGIIHFLIDHRELLQRGDNDTLSGVERVPQIPGGLLLVDGTDGAERMIEACDGLLELGIQVAPVRDDHDRVKDRLILRIMQRGQTVCRPGDGVGFAGTGGVLNQVVMTGSVHQDIHNQFSHHVQLMIAWEDQTLFRHGLLRPVGVFLLFLPDFQADELLDDIQEAVLIQNFLPDIGRHIVIALGLRIPRSAVISGAVGALVEGQKPGLLPFQLGRHPGLIQINGKVSQDTMIELERGFPTVAIILPLELRVINALAG